MPTGLMFVCRHCQNYVWRFGHPGLCTGFQVPFGETAKFTVSNPVLAFVRFSVLDCGKPDRCVGQLTLPFSAIQQGFRNVNLQSQTGHRLPGASLFVHITINSVMRHSYSLID
eukprot:scpid20046/ scgid2199/ 1-phosphatidylinositol 4,5-bisphosphate phosphodiesterase delta-4; Phosphoinositide phospholipase C-delta-4; Phospholipase C-delta-4